MKTKEALGISTTKEFKRNFLLAAKKRKIKNSKFFEIILKDFLKDEYYSFVREDILYNLPILKGISKKEILELYAKTLDNFNFISPFLIYKGKEKEFNDLNAILEENEVLNLKEEIYNFKKSCDSNFKEIDINLLNNIKEKYNFFPVFKESENNYVLYPDNGASFTRPLRFKQGTLITEVIEQLEQKAEQDNPNTFSVEYETKNVFSRKQKFERQDNTVEITLNKVHTPKKYALIPLSKKNRRFFPGYKNPFVLETDIGDITVQVTSAHKGTKNGDATAGNYIQGNLKPWYDKHKNLMDGDKLIIEEIEPNKRYRLRLEALR